MQDELSDTNAPADGASMFRGSNQSGIRAHNERLVLSLIRQRGPLAKVDIARATGLSAQTISIIMRALESDGLLIKCKPVRGKVGQPSVPMRLAEDGAYFLGLKVGRRSVELVLIDFLGKVIDRAFRTYAYPTPGAALEIANDQIDTLLSSLPESRRARVAGLGIAMPSFLWSWANRLGVSEEKMSGWRDADLRADIAALYDFPVFLQNDASAACGAQVVFGPADQPRDFLYFYIGYFIGGGVVLNGALYSGYGNAGALGTMPVATEQGMKSLIDVASLEGLEERQKAEGHILTGTWTNPEDWEFDPDVLNSWTVAAADGMAHAIVSAISLIDFEAVLIDGWIPHDLRSALVAETAAHLNRYEFTGLNRPDIREGTIGPDARAVGAASLPLSKRFLLETNAIQRAI